MRADDAWRAVAEFAATHDGVLTRRQADAHALYVKRVAACIRDGLLHEPVPKVLVVAGTPPTFRQRLRIATGAGGGTAASHRAAGCCTASTGSTRRPSR